MENQTMRGCCGVLPANAPLASPYVPWQPENPLQFPARTGLIRGTLFPCLEFPFLGMVNTDEKTETAMHELQALGFALQELGLYLDTHPDDSEAAAVFEKYAALYDAGMAQYQQSGGPLFQRQAVRDGAYTWNETPWPWEYGANQEE